MFNKLYDYQQKVLQLSKANTNGIFCMPTGTGKTFCQASIIADDILTNKNKIYVVNAPRILLSYQLLKEVYKFLISLNIDARYMFVHSGGTLDEKDLEKIRINSDIPYSQITSGTSIDSIVDIIEKSKEQNLPLILFSTYNSVDRIETARIKTNSEIEMMLNDEAHYLVREDFNNILHTITRNKTFSFTATMINTPSNKGNGMNNAELFGEVLYYMTPRQAIDGGKMVRPRIHILTTDEEYDMNDYQKSLNKIIHKAFTEHILVIKQKPKLLVSVKGTMDMSKFLKSDEYNTLRNNDVNIYAVSSNDEIGNNINGLKVNRQTFLKQLKVVGENINEKLIVLHYDILSEGIDISGFTGLLPLRTLSKSKFLQTFGRCARLDNTDRINIESGKVNSDELNKLNKPYSYVIIPNISHHNEDDKINFINLIQDLRSYDFNPIENIISISNVNGIPEITQLDGLNEINQRFPNIGNVIEQIESEIELEEISNLTDIDFLTKYFN